jgi:polyketide biosynthesis acyl carrier protein
MAAASGILAMGGHVSSEDILEVIASCTREVLPGLEDHPFRRTDRLVDLGANSIDRAEIVMMVLEKLSLKIPRTAVFGPSNIGELSDLLHAKLNA